ncbi:MAG: quinone-dependent dihydroorotate dehydrogenase [bacterium]|nr:quinone-dependent dihydroorotate dehydrogenase [bacterium]
MYKILLRPLLFLIAPERAHHFTINIFKFVYKLPGMRGVLKMLYDVSNPKLETEVFGLKFKNPVGLAAGFDKDAKVIDEFASLGFGFIEIGTVTPKGQPGNPQPRLFRLPADKGLINRMGFNNEGVDAAIKRLKARESNILVGGNIGKNKVTANELATQDYLASFLVLHDYVDYFVVNVSSPNTPNLRELQEKEPLKALLSTLKEKNKEFDDPKPILLKIAPDLTNDQLDDIVEIVEEVKLDGIIAANTTISRADLNTSEKRIEEIGAGGLSGKPVTKRSTEVIRYITEKSGGSIPIIGVGGIHSAKDAIEKLEAGAKLVQLYTGFIYEGPALIKRINKKILSLKK